MTNAADFLAAVWGARPDGSLDGVHFIAEPPPKGWQHHPVTTIAGAVDVAAGISKAGRDAYFACSEFVQERYMGQDGKWHYRTAKNVNGAHAFWLDIDCGAEKEAAGKGYLTKREALAALATFCKAAGVLEPTIVVDSGNGLHCYWHFSDFIPREEWQRLARKLKALTVTHSLIADPSRTAEIASVLRVPGTLNFKDAANPKPVITKRLTGAVDFTAFAAAIDAAMPDAVASVANPFAAAIEKRSPPPETAEEIARAKSMLAAIPADGERETWRNICWSVLATGWTCAEDLAREWSMTAPDEFDEGAFQKVVDSYKPDGGIGFGSLFHIAKQHGRIEHESDALKAALIEINTRYFVARIVGSVYVCDEKDADIISGGMNFTAFRQLYAGRRVNGRNVVAEWLSWSDRRTFEQIVFDPRGGQEANSFNTWRGLAVQPKAGECGRILEHIRVVWCSGNSAQLDYVIRWFALLMQRPWIKPDVALVLRSRQGTGKTIIVELLLRILGIHGFTAAQKEQVAGRFNGHLFDKVLVALEEAFFAGDPAAVAATNALVTNAALGYEAKGKDAFNAPNYAHVISLTNHDWAIPAGEDSRRWMVLDVSDSKRGNHAYFEMLAAEIDNGGAEAFLAHLLTVNVEGWNPRTLPESKALRGQQTETLTRTDPVAAWWLHPLAEGAFTVEGGAVDWGLEVPASDIQESYTRSTARARNAPSWDAAAKRLRRLTPAGTLVKARKANGGARHFYYSLPDLTEARAHFMQVTGVNPCEA